MNGKRIKRNVKSKIQLFWRRFGGAILAIAILSALGFIMFNLNLFYVQKFEVESLGEGDLKYIDQEDVNDLLVDYIGERIFEVDTSAVESVLKNSLSYIDEVYVSKRVPNSLQVRIVERAPTLKLSKGEDIYLIDSDGLVLEDCMVKNSKCGDVPIVKVSYYTSEINVGEQPFITEIDEIIQIIQKQSELGVEITQILVPESGVIYAILDDSTRVIFSAVDDVFDQINLYSYTRENLLLKNEGFKEIDMRFDRPVVRVDKYTY